MKPRFHKSRLASFTLALTAGLLVTTSTSQAVDYWWDNNSTTAGFGTAGGTWAAPTVSQWSTDSTGVATPGVSITTATSDALNFGTATDGLAAGTVTVSGTVSANSLTFGSASGAILLSGGILNLGGTTPTITVNNAANTIDSVIAGSGLTMSGIGVLTLSGANTFSGTTVISDGKISFTNSSAFGTTSVISVRNTSSLEFGANGLDLDRNVQIQNSAGTTKTMQLDLAGTNTGTLSGQLDIRYSTAGDFFINTGADDTLTVSGRVYTGAGGGAGITKTGDGTLILSATNNSYVGVTTVSAGVLNIQHGSALGSVSHSTSVTSGAALQIQGGITTLAEALTLNGTGISNDGALRNISGDNTYAGAITLASATRINSASGTLTLDVASGSAITGTFDLTFGGAGNITVADAIATGTGTLTKDGAGTLTLSGANSYSGDTTINSGTLRLEATGPSNYNTNKTYNINNGSTLVLATGAGTNPTIQGTVVNIDSNGGATITLDGINGLIQGTGGSTFTINSTGGAQNQVTSTGGSGFNAQTVDRPVIFNVASGSNATADFLVTGGMGRSGIEKNGSGKLLFTTSNVGTLGTGIETITINGGIMEIGGSITLTQKSGMAFTNDGTFSWDSTANQTLANTISGSGALTKSNTSTLTLTNANTYTGATTVTSGTLMVNNNTGSGTGSGNVSISSGATLGGGGVIAGAVNVSTGGVISPGNSAGNLTLGNGITLAGIFTWDLTTLSTSNPGSDFDILTITSGNADISGATLGLNLGANAPSAVPFWETDQTWAGIINNTGAGSLSGAFAAIDNSAWSSLGSFSTSNVGNDVNLVWTAVPEPNGALLVGGLGVLALLRRRRK